MFYALKWETTKIFLFILPIFFLSSVIGCYGVSSDSLLTVMIMPGNDSVIYAPTDINLKADTVLDKAIVNAAVYEGETYIFDDIVRGKYKGILYKYPGSQTKKIDGSTVTSDVFALLLKENNAVICVLDNNNEQVTSVYISKGVEDEIESLITNRSAEGKSSRENVQGQPKKAEDVSEDVKKSAASDTKFYSPKEVVELYLSAQQNKNWKEMYQLLHGVPEDISLNAFEKMMDRADGEIISFNVDKYEIKTADTAAVYVTYKYKYHSNRKEMKVDHEPWSCVKVNGRWLVQWLPRQ